MEKRIIDVSAAGAFQRFLQEQERSAATVEKYLRDVRRFAMFAEKREVTKELVMRTEQLMDSNLYVDHTCLKKVLSGTVRKDNTSGCTGVFRKRDKWAARIQYKGKIYSLGCYERLEDAVRARKKAENWVKDDAERLLALLNAPEQAG